jgi:NAD(P)-dependent dehydrogenase (short-subunit alcohol dehydrogenase family)
VSVAVQVAGSKDEAAAELKRVLAQTVLAMPAGLSSFPGNSIVFAQQVQQGSFMQSNGAIRFAFFIDQQREGNSGVFPEMAGVSEVTEADRDKLGPFVRESLLVFAQLRDVLPAEDSPVMAKENNDCRRVGPQGTKRNRPAIRIRQSQTSKPAGERFRHGGHSQARQSLMSSWAFLRARLSPQNELKRVATEAELTMSKIQDAVAVVTGAASGIGRALAKELSREGAQLALADVNPGGLEQTREMLGSTSARTYTVDVSDPTAVEDFAGQVERDFGRASILINNAGVALYGTFAEISIKDFEWLMGINFWGVVNGCKFFVPQLQREPGSHIVNISSVFGLIGPPGQSAYCSSKFAVRGFSECLREELRAAGVRVTCVHPAGIATSIAEKARTGAKAQVTNLEELRKQFSKALTIPAETAAQVIVRAILSNKDRLLIGKDAYRIDLLQRLAPARATAMLTRWLEKRFEINQARSVAEKP